MAKENKSGAKVPNLRFPGFEGEWEVKPIDSFIDLLSGFAFKGEEISEVKAGIPLLRGINITEGLIRHSIEIDRYYLGTITKLGKYFLKEGDLVIGMDGSKVGKNVALINKSDENSLLIQRVVRLRANEKSDIRFIYQNIYSNHFHKYVDIVNTSSGIPHISATQIKAFTIGFPAKIEQQKVATFLSFMDIRIQTQNKIIEHLETLIKNFRNQIFKQKIKFKDAIDFSEWTEVRISDILKIGNGKDYKHLQAGKVPVFGTGGFMTSVDGYLHDGETVCIGRKGTIDKPMYHDGKIWTVDTLFYTHSFQSCIPKFIFYLFQTINWLEHNEASGVPSLSKSTIEKIKVHIPSMKEQKQIASLLTKIDQKHQNEKAILKLLEKQKKYVVNQMFV